MERFFPCSILLVSLFLNVEAQTEAFTRQVQCPTDQSLLGYTSIQDLNDDMMAELARIEGVGGFPDMDYILNLCPDPNNVFDVSGGNSIKPVIDRVQIYCGGPDAVDAVCIIDSSTEQLVVANIVSSLQGYMLNEVLFQGLTFRGFTVLSASLTAAAPASASFIDCVWEDFDSQDIIVIENSRPNSMRLYMENAVIRSSSGNVEDAVASVSFITNKGGVVEIDGIQILDVSLPAIRNNANRNYVLRNENDGEVIVSMATIMRSLLPENFFNTDSGTATFNSVTFSNNIRLNNVFFIRGEDTEVVINDLNFLDNDIGSISRIWNGVNLSQGATLFLSGANFQRNTGVLYGVTVQALQNLPSTAVVEDSTFIGNVGTGVQFGIQSSLIGVLGEPGGQGRPFIDIIRADFEQNSGFTANVNAFLAAEFRLQQACFRGGSNTNVIAVDSSSAGSTAVLNFVDVDEVSQNCPTNPNRLFNTNSMECLTLSDSDVCLSQVVISESPTSGPSAFPTFASDPPSVSPTFASDPPSVSPTFASDPPSVSPTVTIVQSTILPSLSPTFKPTSEVIIATDEPTVFPSNNPPHASGMPSMAISASPTLAMKTGPTATPTVDEIQRTVPVISRPTFRRDCDKYRHGKARGRETATSCGRRRRTFKSTKKLSLTSISSKKNKKVKKQSKSSKSSKSGKSTKGRGKGDRSYWQPLGGARGAYRDHTFRTGSFSNTWGGGDLRGWSFTGVLDPESSHGGRILLSNSTRF